MNSEEAASEDLGVSPEDEAEPLRLEWLHFFDEVPWFRQDSLSGSERGKRLRTKAPLAPQEAAKRLTVPKSAVFQRLVGAAGNLASYKHQRDPQRVRQVRARRRTEGDAAP